MTTRTRIAAITLAVITATAILFFTDAPGLGGFILGAASAAVPAVVIVDQYVAKLRESARELHGARRQYEAAHATLWSQQRRMTAEMEGRIAEQTARLNAAHRDELFRTRMAWFEEGATAALTGRLTDPQEADDASVIPIKRRRLKDAGNCTTG